MNRFRNTYSFVTELLRAPVTLCDCAIRELCSGEIRIDVPVGSLEKQAEWLPVECFLNRICHGPHEISGVTKIVGAKDDGVTGVVHKYGQRSALDVINSHYKDGRVERRRRLLTWVCPKHLHCPVRLYLAAVVPDIDFATSGAKASFD